MANVWWRVAVSLMLALLTAADLNNSSSSQSVGIKSTSHLTIVSSSAVGATKTLDFGERVVTTKSNTFDIGESNVTRKHSDFHSKSYESGINETGFVTNVTDELLKGTAFEKQTVMNSRSNAFNSVDQKKKTQDPCNSILRKNYRNGRMSGKTEEKNVHLQKSVLEPSKVDADGVNESITKTSHLRDISLQKPAVMLLASTSDERKTVFFVQDAVFKLKTNATLMRQHFTSHKNADSLLFKASDSSKYNVRSKLPAANTNVSDISKTKSRVPDAEVQLEIYHSDDERLISAEDPVIANSHDSKPKVSTKILIKNITCVNLSSAVVKDHKVHLKSNSSHFDGPVEISVRINETSSDDSVAAEQPGGVNFKIIVDDSLRQVISERYVSIAATTKSLEDVSITNSVELPIKVNVSESTDDVIINSIELPFKTNISESSEDVDILKSIDLPVRANVSESPENVVIINPIELPVTTEVPDSLEVVTIVSSTDIPVEANVFESLGDTVMINSLEISTETNESDYIEAIAIRNLIAAPVRAKDLKSHTRITIEQNIESDLKTNVSSSEKNITFIEQSVGLGLGGNVSSAGSTVTSETTKKNTMAEIIKSVSTYADVAVNNFIEVDVIDIPAIDYDSATYEPSSDIEYYDFEEPVARSLFNAPRRRKGNGRYINGKYRDSI